MSTAQLSAPPTKLAQILDQAFAAFSGENWPEARAGLLLAIAQRPEDAQLQAALGIVHFKLADYRASCAAFATALRLDPGNPELLTQHAMACLELGDTATAETALRSALEVRPDDVAALKLLSSCYAARGQVAECAPLERRLEILDPQSARPPQPPPADYPRNVPSAEEIKLDAGLTLELGAGSYIHGNHIQNPSGARTHLRIGKFCSIATALTIIGYDHKMEWISMYPFLDKWHRESWPGTASIPHPAAPELGGNTDRGDITVGHDVWIGHDVKLFKGVTIGDGAVIGACSLVTKSVPPYTVVAGIPARPIRQRFTDREIAILQRLAWWDWSAEKINRYLPYLCSARVAELEAALEGTAATPAAPGVPAVPVAPAAPAARQQAQAAIEKFINQARAFFQDVAPPRLTEAHLANSRILPIREDILLHLPRGGVCAEIGTQTGYFAKFIMARLAPAKLHIYDLDFTPFDYPAFEEAIRQGTLELHEGDSARLLAQAPDRHFDFIYIDGDHAYAGVKRDLEQAARKIKPDGWIVCNDYAIYSPLEQMKYGVYRAVNEFCLQHDFEIIYLALQKWGYHDVALRKRARRT